MRLREAILATLRYSAYFSYPLTLAELHPRLLVACSPARLQRELSLLLSSKLINKQGDYYYLSGHKKDLASRTQNFAASQALYLRAQQLAGRLANFPGLLAIYLTGSLAVRNTQDGDIDFMLITVPGRLWLTRLLLTLYLTLLGLRRTPNSTDNLGKLCLNLYLTSDSLALPKSKRSLYTAYELIQAVPLYDPHDTHNPLLTRNFWLKKHLPNYPLPPKRSTALSIHNSLFINLLEKLAYHLQLAYMKPKMTSELITPDSAFFHPSDPGKMVLSKLKLF